MKYSGNTVYDAGVDPAAAAAAERKRLEKEATAFDLWKGSDFILKKIQQMVNCYLMNLSKRTF